MTDLIKKVKKVKFQLRFSYAISKIFSRNFESLLILGQTGKILLLGFLISFTFIRDFQQAMICTLIQI